MARDLNKCTFIGRLGRDPEMRYTPNGSAVTNFSIAVGRSWKDDSGNWQNETEWVKLVAWGKLAETCNQYLAKGIKVYVEAALKTRSWEDKESGEKKYRTEFVLGEMIILTDKKDSDTEEDAPAPTPKSKASAPVKPAMPTPRRNAPQPIENDEDLPF